MPSASERREELKAVFRAGSDCTRCPQLASTRQTVVFGSGNADADLMFVGEAPGANEDKQGIPFVGQAGSCWTAARRDRADAPGRLRRQRLKCRPPGNRDPLPEEIDNCQGYLFRQLELIEPRVVCTLGQLRDEAPARRPDRDHAAARPGRGAHDRPAAGPAVPDLPPGGRALHARACSRRCGPTSPACPSCWRSTRRPSPSRREPEPSSRSPRVEETEASARRSRRRAARSLLAAGRPSWRARRPQRVALVSRHWPPTAGSAARSPRGGSRRRARARSRRRCRAGCSPRCGAARAGRTRSRARARGRLHSPCPRSARRRSSRGSGVERGGRSGRC